MSDVPRTVEETLAPAAEQNHMHEVPQAAKPSETIAESEPTATTIMPSDRNATVVGSGAEPVAAEENVHANKSEDVVDATPISEGVLGYKTPGFIPKFRFQEHFFWFDDAPLTVESLASYVRSKELKTAHSNAAWAQETGKGLLFYAKRVEDRSSPAGMINLSDATGVTKEGADEFVFRAHGQKHTFQVKNAADRAGWLVALEKKIEEAKAMKEEIHNRESYKKHLESFAKAPALAGTTVAATSATHEPKKSLDTAHSTNGTTRNAVAVGGAHEEKNEKEIKSRSQSRKRSSIFGSLLGKKEEKDEQKEVKKEERAEEKAEKEAAKEQKAEEKEIKKEEKAEKKAEKEVLKEEKREEAKATHEHSTATDAGVAAAGAAVPAAAILAEEKKHDKHDSEITTPTGEKKPKRGSIFGSLFAKKDVASHSSERAETDGTPSVPAKDNEVMPISETAPKIEEPIANRPIDTAAVTAPIDTAQTPAIAQTTSQTPKETAAAETSTTPTKEKKGGLIGFIKKEAAKLEGKKDVKKESTVEKKEEKVAETVSRDPIAAGAATESRATADETAAPTTTAHVTEEVKPTERRRSSLFGNLGGSTKKTTHNSESPADVAATDAGTKREKSPLPQRFGSLFRKSSRGVKSEETKEAIAAGNDSMPANETTAASISKDETAITNGSSTETRGSAIGGNSVPNDLHTTVHDSVTITPEVKASA